MTDTTNGTTTIREKIAADIATVGPLPETVPGAIGRTMFDLPGSEDLSVTVLLPAENLQRAPAQAMVRIFSQNDRRKYLGGVSSPSRRGRIEVGCRSSSGSPSDSVSSPSRRGRIEVL
jgi:hypothetical protein